MCACLHANGYIYRTICICVHICIHVRKCYVCNMWMTLEFGCINAFTYVCV